MKYTKEQLQGMSDFERNSVLLNMLGLKVSEEQYIEYSDRDERCVIVDKYSVADTVIDYCNNPSDIMPLAFEHKLTISPQIERFDIPSAGLWVSTDKNWNGKYSVMDKNPLRAIACCLILVLQDKE